MTEDVKKKKKLQTTQRRIVRMIIQTKRQAGTSCAVAQAASASVDVIADAELHVPFSEQGDDMTEHNNQEPNEHEESSHDADSNPCFDEIPDDNPEDELQQKRSPYKADDRLQDALLEDVRSERRRTGRNALP